MRSSILKTKIVSILAIVLGTVLAGSFVEPGFRGAAADQLPPGATASAADDFVVVDCRLPGRVRKLGTTMVYQMPGNVMRTSAHDCEIRGGEYTLLDPSSYAQAIKLWIGNAEAGDTQSQTNVAMLYEKLQPPDYATAASWYAKAASAGYAPAETALARLYEAGLGVPQDKVKAINLYRQAAGINDRLVEDIETPGGDESRGTSNAEVQKLQQQLQEKQNELDKLHRSLQQLESRPGSSSAQPNQKEVQSLHQRIATLEQQIQQGPQATPSSLANLPPPSIEIVYPLATRGGGGVQLQMRSEKGAGDVVGRIHSEIGVRRLTVGQQVVPVDDQLLFAIPPGLLQQGTPTKVEVTDLLGRTSSINVAVTSAPKAVPESEAGGGSFNPKDYYALVIGDDDFRYWPHIDNAVGDARAIEQELRTHYGFKTTLLVNATREQLLGAFNDLRQKMTPDDNLLIYYAGHGQLVPQIDRGYWIPVDAQTNADTEWILNEQITDYLQIIPARHIIVIADSCYAGVLTRSSVEVPKSGLDAGTRLSVLQQLSPKRVRTVMTSGGVQPVLDSGVDGHSIFAAALLRVLRDNDNILEGSRLFDAVSPIVTAQSAKLGYKQTPTYRAIVFAGHEGGDFLFVPSKG
jgi:polyhydroxyalkanoate synthesis regulator phasin